MKTDVKLLGVGFLILTISAGAKGTPLKSNIVINPYINKKIKLKPIDLIKPVSLPSDDNIDYREFIFSIE
jgi:hypothetical protein